MQRVAPWVVSVVVSTGIANHYRGPPGRTECLARRGDLVQDLVRATQATPRVTTRKKILLNLASDGLHMTVYRDRV